jgi:UDP-GlcNAc:undecaprenyl-phosphate/decaprenyl-phosphate GlcNAc-1-phosphate transferase
VLPLSRVELALFGGAVSLAVGSSALLTPLVARWAGSHGMVAAPRQDRWHRQPTPLLGGVAIYAGTLIVILGLARVDARLLGLLVGGSLLFVAGLVDDWRRLRPHTKLVLQILAACVLVVAGVRVETSNLAAIAIPLTILWVVGITNAFNLLDNMDGLSAGTAAIAAFFLFGFSVSVGDAGMALLCLAVAGAALGFLIYNFNPARIFMGDSGSMFLGFMLSGIALLGTREMASDVFFVLLVPAAMMGLPIFDTTLVTIVRTLEGRPLSQGGRDHLSHRLVALGLTERQAVLLLYLLAAGFGCLGLIARSVGVWVSLTVAGITLVVVVLLGAYLAQVRILGPAQFAEAERTDRLADRPVVHGMVMFKRELGLVALDFVLICVSYLGAFVLHFGLPNPQIQPDPYATLPQLLTASLAFVVVVKLVMLLVFRAYRGMWRYIGVADLVSLAKVTVASSAILVLGLPLLLRNVVVIPRSVLVIDWLVFTILLVGSRMSFAALNDTFARLQSRRMPHVLVIGAGDVGEIVLRSLIRSRPTAYRPIGFLDPDPGNRNRSMHGVRVLGTMDDLERVVLERDVDMVVLALANAPRELVDDVSSRCEAIGLPAYQASAFVEMHFAGAFGPLAAEGGAPDSVPRP